MNDVKDETTLEQSKAMIRHAARMAGWWVFWFAFVLWTFWYHLHVLDTLCVAVFLSCLQMRVVFLEAQVRSQNELGTAHHKLLLDAHRTLGRVLKVMPTDLQNVVLNGAPCRACGDQPEIIWCESCGRNASAGQIVPPSTGVQR